MGMIAEAFRTGGVWMYLILSATIMASALTVIGGFIGFKAKRKPITLLFGFVALLAGLGIAGMGAIGYSMGIMQMNEALMHASPEHIDQLREVGTGYARYPLIFGGIAAIFPALGGAILLILGFQQDE